MDPVSGPKFGECLDPKFGVSGPGPIFNRSPDSSAFCRILVEPGFVVVDVFGLGLGLGSIDDVLDFRLET